MAHAGSGAEHHGHHIIPKSLLTKVFVALVGLTILTVATAQLDLGGLNVPLALAIAGTKAALVVMFFMALKYDKRVNSLVFVVGGIFVVVFLAFTLFDTAFRGAYGGADPQTVSEQERIEEQQRAREPDPEQLRMAPGNTPSDPGTQ